MLNKSTYRMFSGILIKPLYNTERPETFEGNIKNQIQSNTKSIIVSNNRTDVMLHQRSVHTEHLKKKE